MGTPSVLAAYDQHGRIIGGDPEQMMDAAAAYVALFADGTDVLLMAADHALRRELSRRIGDDLMQLGIVAAGPAVRIADGAQASPGDLIICTRNDHTVQAGEPGRTLANGDLLRIQAITRQRSDRPPGTGRRPAHGQRRWTDRTFVYANYADTELGYAVTDHTAQGRTVHTGLGRDHRDRGPPARLRRAVPRHRRQPRLRVHHVPETGRPGAWPASCTQLARYDQIYPERTGVRAPDTPPAPPGTALAVLAGVLDRDGEQRSATQARNQALADADQLAILYAIWAAETTPARDQRYRDLLESIPPPGDRREPSHQAKWLWRTLRGAELARQDPGQVLAAAIGERDLAGNGTWPANGTWPGRDLAAVIDARLRHRLGSLVPRPPGPFSLQVPEIADPERRAYVTQIAALMDARRDRIGEYAAEHAPPWAVTALGQVPEDPLDRLDWQRRAGAISAWRELSGYNHPAEPVGPEPVAAAPDLRATWHEAFAALGPADGPDVRGMPDGMLLHLRDTYPIETAWAPKWVGDELRQVRAAAWDARLTGLRASAEAAAAQQRGEHQEAARKQELADSYQALNDAYRQRETVFAATMADRDDWEKASVQQRHLAVVGDAELRRRHPDEHYPLLRSAEPEPATSGQREELTMAAGEETREGWQWIKLAEAYWETCGDGGRPVLP